MPERQPNLDPETLFGILDVSRLLAVPIELRELLGRVIDAGRRILGVDRGTVFLYDDGTKELYATVATGSVEREMRFSVDRGIAGQCARERQVINVPDCYADPRFNREIDRRTGYRTRCLMAVPLIGLEDELVGVMQLLNPDKPRFDETDERIGAALGAQAAVAIQRARLIEDRMARLKLEADLDLARSIQMNVLPKTLPASPGYDLADFSEPADQTGGDIYDVVPLDAAGADGGAQRLMLFLADATGHGIGPALSVTQARAMLRMALRYSHDLDELLRHINAQLTDDLESSRFVTAFVGVLDAQRHRVTFHAPGQGPLLHFQAANRECRWFDATTIPLGIMDDPPEVEAVEPIEMAPGDMLVLLTDGFYEYQSVDSEEFGRDRVGEVVTAHCAESASKIVQRLVEEVRRFAGSAPQRDDLTALLVKRNGA
ncbi:MAG: protein phosphatase [Phycisphaeraceae bacterium]|nr:protein phosphatase [Phycisphaeraceae bacterium]